MTTVATAIQDGRPAGLPALPRRVLYVQHAGCLGGSAMSLRYLVQAMQEAGVECTVALARPSTAMSEFYADAGIPTVAAPDICCWDHSTVAPRSLLNPRHVYELGGVAARWRSSREATLRLVDRVAADLVHLNSMPLSSSASVLTEAGVPFVWHVREPPPDQGVRTAMIRRLMLAAPCPVFITRHDKEAWIGAAPGHIIYNCVPDSWFQRAAVERDQRAGDAVRFAYLGGFAAAKGAAVLLEALRILRRTDARWECIMPGCLYDERPSSSGRRWLKRAARAIGVRSPADHLLAAYGELAPAVVLQPFRADIAAVLESVDFVVFPATRPHFPRPVIEAAAVGRPAVGTDVGGVNECVIHGDTGLLCRPGDAASLAAALEEMIRRPELRAATGRRARERAAAVHTLSAQRLAVARIYGDVLGGSTSGGRGADRSPAVA
jgi:glycosyltransferase involved in cell wall biosynthesis